MTFIKKNRDWIFAIAFALATLTYPTIKFITKMIEFINNYGSEKESITFLWYYILLIAGGSDYFYQVFFFVLLLPVPLVFLASYRFQNNVTKNMLIQEEYSKKNNQAIVKEVLQSYKRVTIYVMAISFLFLIITIIIPNSGFSEPGSDDVIEAIKMNIGFVLFSLIASNISIIAVRFTKKYRNTMILGVLGFVLSTLLIALIFEGIGNALSLELLNMDLTFYSVIWSGDELKYLVQLGNGIISFLITGYIVYLLYIGDKSIED